MKLEKNLNLSMLFSKNAIKFKINVNNISKYKNYFVYLLIKLAEIMHFGKNIKKIRSIKKLSQSGFAEIFGITRSSIGAYEEGRAEPKLEIIIKIAKHFSISVDSLVNSEITVNELSNFHLLDNYINSSSVNSSYALDINITNIPLISSLEIKQGTISIAKKQSKHQISLPALVDGSVGILIEDALFSNITNQIKKKDIIIINPDCELMNINLQNSLCFVKMNGELFILPVTQVKNGAYLLQISNKAPLLVKGNKVELLLPIEQHISNAPAVVEDSTEKIKKLEYMVNDLYNRLE